MFFGVFRCPDHQCGAQLNMYLNHFRPPNTNFGPFYGRIWCERGTASPKPAKFCIWVHQDALPENCSTGSGQVARLVLHVAEGHFQHRVAVLVFQNVTIAHKQCGKVLRPLA